jgi:hypothetical protein
VNSRAIEVFLLDCAMVVGAELFACGAMAADPPKPGVVTVLDEACVDRRVDMCLRLADGSDAWVIASTSQEMCSTQACRIGWYKTVVVPFGALGPLCICERRSVGVAAGQRCAEGFREFPMNVPGGGTQIACELPDMKMEQYRGGWEWIGTPSDLLSCLEFARFGPGSGSCRKPAFTMEGN